MTPEGSGPATYSPHLRAACPNADPGQSYNYYNNFTWTDPSGTLHTFPINTQQDGTGCVGGDVSSDNEYASDASGYEMFVTNYKTVTAVYANDGTQLYPTYKDRNGNSFSSDDNGNLIDMEGRIPVKTTTDCNGNANEICYDVLNSQYNGSTGTSRYTVMTEPLSVSTSFDQSGITEYAGSFTAFQSIQLPNSSTYTFTYDTGTSGNYGELTGLTLPTSGQITYSYDNFTDMFGNLNQWLLTRTSAGAKSIYAATLEQACTTGYTYCQLVTAFTANGATSAYFFNSNAGSNGAWATSTTYANGTTPILAETTTWTSTLNGAQVSSLTTQLLDAPSQPSKKTQYTYGAGSLPLTIAEWDYRSTTQPTNADRLTTYTYGYNAGLTSGHNIIVPTSITQTDGAITQTFSKTNITYDGSGLTSVTGIINHDDTNYGATLTVRGNPTSTSTFVGGSTYITTNATYDTTGQLRSTTDPSGITTSMSYADQYYYSSSATPTSYTPTTPTNAYLTSVTLPLSGSISYGYYYGTGQSAITTDQNGAVSRIPSYDLLNRPNELDSLSSGSMVAKTGYFYRSVNQTGIETYQNASVYQDTETLSDSYGRPSRVAISNGSSNTNASWNQQDVCYDSGGRPTFSSYAYQGSGFSQATVCSGAGDTYTYDVLNRVKSVVHSDNTSITYTHVGRATKVTDENGVARITQVDGFGRTISVCEVSGSTLQNVSPVSCGQDIAATGFLTQYAYNFASHTTTVIQGAQTRTFQTDALGRTISVIEPESGTTTYSYNYIAGSGLRVIRTRPQANQTNPNTYTTTTTQYDGLGRITSVTYSDNLTPTKTFAYDMATGWNNTTLGASKGRLTYASTGPSTTSPLTGTQFSYDTLGRVTATSQCLPTRCSSATFNVQRGYSYDWASNLIGDSYFPQASSGALVSTRYTVNVAGAVTAVSNSLTGPSNNSGAILSNLQSGAFGPISYQYGNGLSAAIGYDTLGRLAGHWVCNGSTQAYCTGGTQVYGFSATWNGSQVQGVSDTVLNSGATFGYDEFNRLKSSTYSNRGQAFSYVYDLYGNRVQQNVTQGSGPAPQMSVNAANNQVTSGSGDTYDAAGNVMSDGIHSYTYDAEGNLISVDNCATAGYAYDAFNNRVQSVANGVNNLYAYNLFNQRVSIWDGGSSVPQLISATTYWNGQPISYFDGYTTTFQHQDGEGTERLRTGADGSLLGSYQTLAFGDGMDSSGSDNDAHHYAQLDFDAETWTSHAQFRQYNQTQGRWMQPDPYSGSYDFSNPQSFNRYSYVLNNPLSLIDPTGLDCAEISKASGRMDGGKADDGCLGLDGGSDGSGGGGDGGTSGGGSNGAYNDPNAGGGTTVYASPWDYFSTVIAFLELEIAAVPAASYSGGAGSAPSSLVQQGRKMFSSNCNSKFASTIPHYTNSAFFNQLANAPFQQYPAGTPNIPDHAYGADADTALGQPGRPIRLFPNFYGNDPTYQAFTLIHEGIHRFTGWSDAQVFMNFGPSGLQPPGSGYGTGNITSWLQGGCKP